MAGLLEGIKVIDMGHAIAVPAAGVTMGDWGADVIKIEPLFGEMARETEEMAEVNLTFELVNRNKKGLALDLKQESGVEILHKLVRRADVFISNYEVSALKKLKADYATLSKVNPSLIYGVVTGYGALGPDKDERGFDYTAAWARSGTQYLMSEPGFPPPLQRFGQVDRVAAAHVVAGVLAALLHRGKTGEGQELSFSLYHTGVWCLAQDIQVALAGQPLTPNDRTKAVRQNPVWNTYCTKDGRWINLALIRSHLHWTDFCRAIDKPELENDPRFIDKESRAENCEELVRILDGIFATKNMEEWDNILRANNCIYSRVATPEEVVADPQALANDFFSEVDHPVAGKLKLINVPVNFRQNPASIRTLAPELGQHTEEILLDLGYKGDDIAPLKKQGVIL